jgi:hypothetical protein
MRTLERGFAAPAHGSFWHDSDVLGCPRSVRYWHIADIAAGLHNVRL